MNKEFDLIVFGATGFTGDLVCNYLSTHKDAKNLNWAIAGRNLEKLSKISRKYSVEYIVADSFDLDSLNEMCSRGEVIISTVGPYMIYGENLIYSCIKNKSHYLDLTGEPEFVLNMAKKYSKEALDSGSMIIHCCGFESIPADVGVFEALKEIAEDNVKLSFYLKTKGQISGGTWASFLNSVINPKTAISAAPRKKKKSKNKKIFYAKRFKRWALFFPVIDKYIVYKSIENINRTLKGVSFNQYILQKSFLSMILLIGSIFTLSIIAKISIIKDQLLKLIPSGSGPSADKRKNNWFEATILAEGKEREVVTIIKGGDPGYGETSKFISEMALAIIVNKEELLNDKGILTPIECAGEILPRRLQNAGISIKTTSKVK